MKKWLSLLAVGLLSVGLLSGFSLKSAEAFADREITVVSRENGSGTRGAFIELLKVEARTPDGGRKDLTTQEAIIANRTDVMMTNIAGDTYAIGYISLGSVNSSIKALAVDGVQASTANVKNGSYKISRPFIIATKGAPNGVTKDFIDFVMSREGQAIIAKNYISVNESAAPYNRSNPTGRIVIAGSSSVTPVMEELVEAYRAINSNVNIEVHMSDSGAGIKAASEGTCDIGMSSRELKDSEKSLLNNMKIAIDGIAVIVNNNNGLQSISSDNVRKIFTGEITNWNQVK